MPRPVFPKNLREFQSMSTSERGLSAVFGGVAGLSCGRKAPDQPEAPFKEEVVAYRARELIASDGAG